MGLNTSWVGILLGGGHNYFEHEEWQQKVAASHRILQWIEEYKPERGILLEVGCAGGSFLMAASERGWKSVGVEVSQYACEQARQLGLDIFCGELSYAKLPSRFFDVVYLQDVIEHVPDPGACLKEIARILKTDGILVMFVPTYIETVLNKVWILLSTAKQSIRGLMGKRSGWYMEKPYHLYEFMPCTLNELLTKCGLQVLQLENTASKPAILLLRGSGLLTACVILPLLWLFYFCVRAGFCMGDRTTVVATLGKRQLHGERRSHRWETQ